MPATNPSAIAVTDEKVTGSPKKTRPDKAIGNLLRAPTMEYVVDEVVRTHQADVYEMPTVVRPETIMLSTTAFRALAGKLISTFDGDQSSRTAVHTKSTGIDNKLL